MKFEEEEKMKRHARKAHSEKGGDLPNFNPFGGTWIEEKKRRSNSLLTLNSVRPSLDFTAVCQYKYHTPWRTRRTNQPIND